MRVIEVHYTRGDSMTAPGGLILRESVENGKPIFIVHHFQRDRGSKRPTSFFWGRYCSSLERARAALSDKLKSHTNYTRGGSIIDPAHLERELEMESDLVA